MRKGTKEFKQAERAAQQRNNIPIDKAGLDYIHRRSTDWDAYREGIDRIFGKKGETKNG